MAKKGPKPKSIIDLTWRPELAYAIGLIATDGYLSSDGLLVDITSKDREQLLNFSKCLGVCFTIGRKWNSRGDECLRIQFKNRLFYDFLLFVGLTPRKSLTLGEIKVPDQYFFDLLRGCFDGDGCFYSYWDPRWKSSHMFYIQFTSASKKYIVWLQDKIFRTIRVRGHIATSKKKGRENHVYNLKFAKKEALEIIRKMYYSSTVVCLSRKKKKIENALKVEKTQQEQYI